MHGRLFSSSIYRFCKKEQEFNILNLEEIEESKIFRSVDVSSNVRSPLKPLHNRFSVAKLEEATASQDQTKEDTPSSPSKRKLIIKSSSIVKTETHSPYMMTPLRDHKALVEHDKEKTDKKIKINREWRKDVREAMSVREYKSASVDLDVSSPLKPYPSPVRSKSLNYTEGNYEYNPSLNSSQVSHEIRLGSKSPVRISSFRHEQDSKLTISKSKPVPVKPKQESSLDKYIPLI